MAEFEPVGCMIFNNSSLAGIPWELLLKDYRSQRKDSLPTIKHYSDDFREYVEGGRSSGLLPEQVRNRSTAAAVAHSVKYVLDRILGTVKIVQDKEGLNAVEAIQKTIEYALIDSGEGKVSDLLSSESLDGIKQKHKKDVREAIENVFSLPDNSHLSGQINNDIIVDLVFATLFFKPLDILASAYTGLVFAGYGRDQYLPSCISLKVFGFIGDRLLYQDGEGFTMEHTGRSCYITPFATRSMVETFMLGASSNVYSFVQRHFLNAATQACKASYVSTGAEPNIELINQLVNDQVPKFMEGWIHDVSRVHLLPLLDIVGGLSLEELGELADTLVMLESLKEKVTYRTQSVGGPIDVALITKSDGLVWIKRKLYFDASLNHRYLARIERKHRSEQ
ncbi:hypothetical protein [Delftia acidovorans]|uniref:hypothetical protein n=1 Tax=Delftia acidovorans TaxID=80866 RepID=UPI003D0A6476